MTPCSLAFMDGGEGAARNRRRRSSSVLYQPSRRYPRRFASLSPRYCTHCLSRSRLAPEPDLSLLPKRNKHLAHIVPLDPIVETPVKDLRLVSAMLKKADPVTPSQPASRDQQLATPSSLPPLPPSVGDTHRSISAMVLSKPKEVVKKMMQTEVATTHESVKAFRGVRFASFLQNANVLITPPVLVQLA